MPVYNSIQHFSGEKDGKGKKTNGTYSFDITLQGIVLVDATKYWKNVRSQGNHDPSDERSAWVL